MLVQIFTQPGNFSTSFFPPTLSNSSSSRFSEEKRSTDTLQSTFYGFYLHCSTETSLAEVPNDLLGPKPNRVFMV